MHTTDMSAVQQRTKRLQKIISEISVDDASLQKALAHELYDLDSRTLSFAKVLSRRRYGTLQSSSRSSLDLASKLRLSTSSQSPKPHTLCRRVLVIFIRHFLCGNCQEYLLRLSAHPLLSQSNLSKHGVNITIIGCGSPSHIASYRALTKLPEEWLMYADPSTDLYNTLGMQRSLKLGDKRPVYIQRTLTGNMLRSMMQGVKRVPKGDVGKAGSWDVNGGEFLFELRDDINEWQLRWCHQMENSRDHTEVEDLISVTGLRSASNSPTLTSPSENVARLHTRSQSSPPFSEDDSIINQKLEAQVRLSQRLSLGRKLPSRRQSWFDWTKQTSMSPAKRRQVVVAT